MQYFVWKRRESDESFTWIKNFTMEIESEDWTLCKGISCADWFPQKTEIQICSDKGIQLTDAIPNSSNLLVLSEKLKSIFENNSGALFEYFPVTILDKKGRPEKRSYYVANLLDTVDCVDMEKSSFVMDSIIKDQVMYFKELVLDESKIPDDKEIFRLKDQTNLIIVNYTLARKILDEKCTGMRFVYVRDHGKIHRD